MTREAERERERERERASVDEECSEAGVTCVRASERRERKEDETRRGKSGDGGSRA